MTWENAINGPILLNPCNFIPFKKTPWAGQTILANFKSDMLISDVPIRQKGQKKIGESWEYSCDPHLPSHLREFPGTLNDLFDVFPLEAFACFKESEKQKGFLLDCKDLMVKLINAEHPLSFQVHPSDNDPNLKSGECGKIEAWLVIDAQPDSGVYLGFKDQVSYGRVRSQLNASASLEPYLQFVPVSVGDYFEIDATVPHAIGGGVTVLEPQKIRYGKQGKTYRLWDWNRKYDRKGRIALTDGFQRPIHAQEALSLIDPTNHIGPELIGRSKVKGTSCQPNTGTHVTRFGSNSFFRTEMGLIIKNYTLHWYCNGFAMLQVLEGCIEISSRLGISKICFNGQPVLLPFYSSPFTITAKTNSKFALITPTATPSIWA